VDFHFRRKAAALEYTRCQVDALTRLSLADLAVLEIAFDESDQPASVLGVAGIWPMMMLHCRLWWRPLGSDGFVKYELSLPPSFLQDTTAATLANAVLMRLPMSMQDIKKKSTVLLVVINTDAAPACIRAAKHFRSLASLRRIMVRPNEWVFDGMLALHAKCLMHQLALIVARLMKDTM
jgi:hypothetical protein